MSEKTKSYIRFNLAQRLEHILLILSFTLLALTGLPQKYALSPISEWFIALLGGIETVRVIHRIAATVFLAEAIYHLVVAGYKLFVRRERASMVPTVKDGKDIFQSIQYNLGMRNDEPKMPRYNYSEKMEYWAMLWGFFVMALTGFMLWNPIMTTNLLPGDFIPAAKVAHGGEAVLAVLAIILWHFYNVHIKTFNKSMFTGRMTRHEMEEEHREELEVIESGRLPQVPAEDVRRRRLVLYVPVAAITSLVLLIGVYYFVSFEETSITTLPPAEQAQAFLPQTPTPVPPTATPAPTVEGGSAPSGEGGAASVGWNGDIEDVFKQTCAGCHGTMGGYSVASYADAMTKIEPGSPDTSAVVEVQRGEHPGKFTPEDLDRVIAWIQAGALEQGSGGAAEEAAVPSDSTWNTNVSGLFEEKCTACHGRIGGFSAETYADVMEKVVPGNPDASPLVQAQKTSHPGLFTSAQLRIIIAWITAGAPE